MTARKAAATTQKPDAVDKRRPAAVDAVMSSSRRPPDAEAGRGIPPRPASSPALLYAAHAGRIEARRQGERVAERGRPRRAADDLGELRRGPVDPLRQGLHRVV